MKLPDQNRFFHSSSQEIGEPLHTAFRDVSSKLKAHIRSDKSLSRFDQFDTRFIMSWNMQIGFNDASRVSREDTIACYALMLKISDLWASFEHLQSLLNNVVPKELTANSKVNFYREQTLASLNCSPIVSNFTQLFYDEVFTTKVRMRDMFRMLPYLKNNTKGAASSGTHDFISQLKLSGKIPFNARHIFALAYALRNLYVHDGIAAAMGSGNYKLKRDFYEVLYDTLILFSLRFGYEYASRMLPTYENVDA